LGASEHHTLKSILRDFVDPLDAVERHTLKSILRDFVDPLDAFKCHTLKSIPRLLFLRDFVDPLDAFEHHTLKSIPSLLDPESFNRSDAFNIKLNIFPSFELFRLKIFLHETLSFISAVLVHLYCRFSFSM